MRKQCLLAGITCFLLLQLFLLRSNTYFKTLSEDHTLAEKKTEITEKNLLEDIQKSIKQPTRDETIFFIVTTCYNDNLMLLGRR